MTLRAPWVGALLAAVGLTLTFTGGGVAFGAPAPVGLGTAGAFSVLAGSTVTSTGATLIRGELGVSPGTAVTGFPPGIVLDGTIHAADATAGQAQQDLTIAYADAASRPVTAGITADLGGQTLVPGVYGGAALALTGTLTLDAQGDPAAVFLFQAESTLTTASASRVLLVNGADPCSVFWQIGSSATLGTNSSFVGTLLVQTAVTAQTGAQVAGRLLARTAAVTLDNTAVSQPVCGTVTPTPSTSATPTGSPTATASATSTASTAPTATATTAPTTTASTAPTTVPTATSTAAAPSPGASAAPTPSASSAAPVPAASSPTPTGTTATAGPSAGGAGAPTPSNGTGGLASGAPLTAPELPQTGVPLVDTVLLGLVLTGLGAALLVSARFRRTA